MIRKIKTIRYLMNEFIIFNIYISELINNEIEIPHGAHSHLLYLALRNEIVLPEALFISGRRFSLALARMATWGLPGPCSSRAVPMSMRCRGWTWKVSSGSSFA